jgi:hypothetical protein
VGLGCAAEVESGQAAAAAAAAAAVVVVAAQKAAAARLNLRPARPHSLDGRTLGRVG